MATYDPNRAPVPEEWLALGEAARIEAVRVAHRGMSLGDARRDSLHAITHAVVENQIALGQPPAVRATLARLTGAGVARHEAIHAIGAAFAGQLFDAMNGKAPDMAKYERDLAALEPKEWQAGK